MNNRKSRNLVCCGVGEPVTVTIKSRSSQLPGQILVPNVIGAKRNLMQDYFVRDQIIAFVLEPAKSESDQLLRLQGPNNLTFDIVKEGRLSGRVQPHDPATRWYLPLPRNSCFCRLRLPAVHHNLLCMSSGPVVAKNFICCKETNINGMYQQAEAMFFIHFLPPLLLMVHIIMLSQTALSVVKVNSKIGDASKPTSPASSKRKPSLTANVA